MIQIRENNYSSEVHDALQEHPRWMMRWGIETILLMLLFLLAASYFYKYPDIVIADVVIASDRPPVSMVGKVDGKIEQVFVTNGQKVSEGDWLVLMHTPANFRDVEHVRTSLQLFDKWMLSPLKEPSFTLNKNLSLGTLQEHYSSLVEEYEYYRFCLKSSYFASKVSMKKKQMALYEISHQNILRQNYVLGQELKLVEKQIGRDSALFKGKVISEEQFEDAKIIYLQKLFNYKAAEASLSNLRLRIEEMKDQILDLEQNEKVKLDGIQRSLQKKSNNLLSALALWDELYLIKSPVQGEVSLSKFYSAGLNARAGETIISVIPDESSTLMVRAEASMKNAGKLNEGLKVNIKLENYPYLEYGMLKGTVKEISKLSEDKRYYLTIELNYGLATSLKKELQLSQRMSGTAEIVTEDKRLIERIVDPILTLFKQ